MNDTHGQTARALNTSDRLALNILSYTEHKIKNTEEKYQISEIGKTIAKYIFLLITTGQALGPEQAVVASAALEYLSTAIKGRF